MISIEEYEQAKAAEVEAKETIRQYHQERMQRFEQRMQDNPIFTDDELFYSARNLYPCGHELAYPKECGLSHYWDCSAILKGIADPQKEHTPQLPFAFYDVKGESEYNGTTRGVFMPQPVADKQGG